MRTLSIRQPYAELILRGHKTIEYRSWSTDYRGPVIIHAGGTFGHEEQDSFEEAVEEGQLEEDTELPRGGVVGLAYLVDVTDADEIFEWHMESPMRLPFTSMNGKLKLYDTPWDPAWGPEPTNHSKPPRSKPAAASTPPRSRGVYKGSMTREQGLKRLAKLAERMGIQASDIKVRRAEGEGMRLMFRVGNVDITKECHSQASVDHNFVCLVLWLGDLVRNVERGVESFSEAFYNEGGRQLLTTGGESPIARLPYEGSKTIKDSLNTIEGALERLSLTKDHVKVRWESTPPMARMRIGLDGGRIVEKVSMGQTDERTNLAALALWLQTRAKNYERGIERDLNTLFAANLLPPASQA